MALGADVRRRQNQGPALQVVKVAREPLRPEAHAGLEFVRQRRNGAHWAGVRSRPRSGGHLRILSFFASEAWNLSHCTCQAPRTTNTQPSLQTAETRYAFVGSQHSREHLRAIIQNEWGLDLCSSLPRCSLSVGPLVWPRRRERPGFPAVKPRESMGRAGGRESGLCPCGADGAHRPVRGRRGTSGGPVRIHAEEEDCLLWKPGPLAWQSCPRSPHACLPASCAMRDRGYKRGAKNQGETLAFSRPHRVFQRITGRHNEGRRSEACAVLKVALGGAERNGVCHRQARFQLPPPTPVCLWSATGPTRPGPKPRWELQRRLVVVESRVPLEASGPK